MMLPLAGSLSISSSTSVEVWICPTVLGFFLRGPKEDKVPTTGQIYKGRNGLGVV